MYKSKYKNLIKYLSTKYGLILLDGQIKKIDEVIDTDLNQQTQTNTKNETK